MIHDESLIEGCIAGKRRAQNDLYRKYSAIMFALCYRYAQNREEAEDILQEGFLKIFQYIKSYRKEGSFEGWMKRIMINHALNLYRKQKTIPVLEDLEQINETEILEPHESVAMDAPVSAETIVTLVHSLPPGYRMVFNMYVFEEYSHKEISEALNISENTSKTQLLKARRMLRKKLDELTMVKNTIAK